jgi:hypothetical protein
MRLSDTKFSGQLEKILLRINGIYFEMIENISGIRLVNYHHIQGVKRKKFLKVKCKYLLKLLRHKIHPHESPRQELASLLEILLLGKCFIIASPLNCCCHKKNVTQYFSSVW